MTLLSLGKTICHLRCLKALFASIIFQFFYIFLYQLCIHFHLFHPINWLTSTFTNSLSFYTCIRMIIIIIFVGFYASLIGTSYMKAHNCYEIRFQRLTATATRIFSSFLLHLSIGLTTAWVYISYLDTDFSLFRKDSIGNECINSRYLYLLGAGLLSSFIHFLKDTINWDVQVDFSGIQLKPLLQLRVNCATTLKKYVYNCFPTCILLTLLYWLFESYINRYFLNVEIEKSSNSLKTFVCLSFYCGLITTLIRTNIYMIQRTFVIYLSQDIMFPIERGSDIYRQETSVLTLADALSMAEIPVLQKLAVYDFYKICNDKLSTRRHQILSLTLPGNHPNNWNQIATRCLGIFQAYIEELIESMKSMSYVSNKHVLDQMAAQRTCPQDTINQILTRQYNEMHGIRRLGTQTIDKANSNNNSAPKSNIITSAQRLNAKFDRISNTIQMKLKEFIYAIPGYNYLFGYLNTARIVYVLSYSDIVARLCLSLSLFCVASLWEDKYGVVQLKIKDIIHEILKLKTELDRLNNALANNRKAEEKLRALQNSVQRSLIMLCSEFKDFLDDFTEPDDLRKLHCLMNK